jgi:hypothetical protein
MGTMVAGGERWQSSGYGALLVLDTATEGERVRERMESAGSKGSARPPQNDERGRGGEHARARMGEVSSEAS